MGAGAQTTRRGSGVIVFSLEQGNKANPARHVRDGSHPLFQEHLAIEGVGRAVDVDIQVA